MTTTAPPTAATGAIARSDQSASAGALIALTGQTRCKVIRPQFCVCIPARLVVPSPSPARVTQWESASLTRMKSLVQSQPRALRQARQPQDGCRVSLFQPPSWKAVIPFSECWPNGPRGRIVFPCATSSGRRRPLSACTRLTTPPRCRRDLATQWTSRAFSPSSSLMRPRTSGQRCSRYSN